MTVQVTFRGDDPAEEEHAMTLVRDMLRSKGARVVDPRERRHLRVVSDDEVHCRESI